ncbi:UNVERIFIED_CONTAM: Protein FLX-like 1 [Sesamum indicum]
MSTRNRGPPIPPKGGPHGGLPQPPIHEQPFARGLRGVPHPALHDEMREAHYSLSGPRPLPPHPVIIEERLAAQHDDIQALLVDNQRLAATHVALRQELEVAQYELQRADKYARTLHAEKESETRELYEKSVKMENELHALNAMRSELMQVHMDIKELTAAREDLTAQVQMMTQDLGRVTSDLQQVPTIKSEIEGLRHELERARLLLVRRVILSIHLDLVLGVLMIHSELKDPDRQFRARMDILLHSAQPVLGMLLLSSVLEHLNDAYLHFQILTRASAIKESDVLRCWN